MDGLSEAPVGTIEGTQEGNDDGCFEDVGFGEALGRSVGQGEDDGSMEGMSVAVRTCTVCACTTDRFKGSQTRLAKPLKEDLKISSIVRISFSEGG